MSGQSGAVELSSARRVEALTEYAGSFSKPDVIWSVACDNDETELWPTQEVCCRVRQYTSALLVVVVFGSCRCCRITKSTMGCDIDFVCRSNKHIVLNPGC